MLLSFNEQAITQRLQTLSWHLVLAFGAACAERMLSNYQKFVEETGWGDTFPLSRALDIVWQSVLSQSSVDEGESSMLAAACEAIVPDSEAFESLYTTSAQDAVFAVCSLLDYCRAREVAQVVLAARYPTDSIDLYVQELEGMEPGDPSLESNILSHPLVQRELMRQDRDLCALEVHGTEGTKELFARRKTEPVFGP